MKKFIIVMYNENRYEVNVKWFYENCIFNDNIPTSEDSIMTDVTNTLTKTYLESPFVMIRDFKERKVIIKRERISEIIFLQED